jgi:small-conductance mechanosensitive channel
MKKESLPNLLADVLRDLRHPDVLWQLGALLLCLLVAGLIARAVRKRARVSSQGFAGGLVVLLFPVAALILVMIARGVAGFWIPVNVLRLAVPLLLSMAMIRIVFYALRLVIAPGGLLAAFERTIALVVWGVVALHIIGLAPLVIDYLDDMAITVAKSRVSLWTLLQAAFWSLITLLAALWLSSSIEARLMRADNLHSSLRVALSRVGKSLLILFAVLIVLQLVGLDLTVLSVFGGALGVGLGFGLQKVVSNYISGYIILLDRSVQIGDMITADNFYGEVNRVTTRYVVLRALDGREAIIPNDTLMSQTVLNHTHSIRRLVIPVQVGYDTDIDRAIEVLCSAARSHERVLKEPAPEAYLVRFADSGIDMEVGFSIRDPEKGGPIVRSDIARGILAGLRQAGIDIPFPHRVIRNVTEQRTSDAETATQPPREQQSFKV